MGRRDVRAAQAGLAAKVMGRPGVEGVAIGEKCGAPCLIVYVSDSRAEREVPSRFDGFAVVVERSGGFRRL